MSDYSEHTNYKLRLAIAGTLCAVFLLWGAANLVAEAWLAGGIGLLLGVGSGILADTSFRMLQMQRKTGG